MQAHQAPLCEALLRIGGTIHVLKELSKDLESVAHAANVRPLDAGSLAGRVAGG